MNKKVAGAAISFLLCSGLLLQSFPQSMLVERALAATKPPSEEKEGILKNLKSMNALSKVGNQLVRQNKDGVVEKMGVIPNGASVLVSDEGVLNNPSLTGSAEVSGYIIKLKTAPLIEKYIELSPTKDEVVVSMNAGAQSGAAVMKDQGGVGESMKATLSALRKTIETEQGIAESKIKSLSGNVRIKRKFSGVINGLSVANITENEAASLKKLGYEVFPNYKVKKALGDSVPLTGAPTVWSIMKDGSGKPVTGTGMKIGIIDTGIDYRHADLGGCSTSVFLSKQCAKVVGGYDFVYDDPDPMDDEGHGTHVAATAAGKMGVAPDAQLFAYKVMDKYGSGYTDDIIAAINMTTDPNGDGDFSDRLDIINLSLGGPGTPDDPLSKAVDNAANLGVLPVVAAGNSGPYEKTVMQPGSARRALTVGAHDKSGVIASFSSRGPVIWNGKALVKPDIIAPGVSICAAKYPGMQYGTSCLDSTHVSISGTSMATPHVAGAAALLKQLKPSWSVRQIKAALKNTALPVTNLKQVDQGNGKMNVLAAAQLKTTPIVVELEPISTKQSGLVPLLAFINTPAFKNLTVEVENLTTKEVKVIYQATTTPLLARVTKITDLNVDTLVEGEHSVRLTISDTNGNSATSYGYIKMDKISLSFPLNNDILRRGATIKLATKRHISLASTTPAYKYRYVTDGIWKSLSGDLWNTAGLSQGDYEVGFSLTDPLGGVIREDYSFVYLSDSLRVGWPQRVNWECFTNPDPAIGKVCYHGGYLTPVVSDLDGDKKEEILVVKGGNPGKLVAYGYNGQLKWQVNIGTAAAGGFAYDAPLIYDFDGDGKKEIAVTFENNMYVFTYAGQPFSGMPHPVNISSAKLSYTLVAGDIEGDGKGEVVALPSCCTNRSVVIIGNDGNIKKSIPMPDIFTASILGMHYYPALGNLDSDNDLEIAIFTPSEAKTPTNSGYLYALNADGSSVGGFPIKVPGLAHNNSPVIGDVDGDGSNEIIIGLFGIIKPNANEGGLHVYKNNGSLLSGFPVLEGKSLFGSPALADLEKDGKLDILVNAAEGNSFEMYIVNHSGTLRSGWPASIPNSIQFGPLFAGVGKNGGIAGVATTDGYVYEFGTVGGVYAWELGGVNYPVLGFPKVTEILADAPAAVTDIDGNGVVDIVASSDEDLNFKTRAGKLRGSIYAWLKNVPYQTANMPWARNQHDEARSGRYVATSATTSTKVSAMDILEQDEALVSGLKSDIVAESESLVFNDNSCLGDPKECLTDLTKVAVNNEISQVSRQRTTNSLTSQIIDQIKAVLEIIERNLRGLNTQ